MMYIMSEIIKVLESQSFKSFFTDNECCFHARNYDVPIVIRGIQILQDFRKLNYVVYLQGTTNHKDAGKMEDQTSLQGEVPKEEARVSIGNKIFDNISFFNFFYSEKEKSHIFVFGMELSVMGLMVNGVNEFFDNCVVVEGIEEKTEVSRFDIMDLNDN